VLDPDLASCLSRIWTQRRDQLIQRLVLRDLHDLSAPLPVRPNDRPPKVRPARELRQRVDSRADSRSGDRDPPRCDVPAEDVERSTACGNSRVYGSANCARNSFGKLLIASNESTPRLCIHSAICWTRAGGETISLSVACSCAGARS